MTEPSPSESTITLPNGMVVRIGFDRSRWTAPDLSQSERRPEAFLASQHLK